MPNAPPPHPSALHPESSNTVQQALAEGIRLLQRSEALRDSASRDTTLLLQQALRATRADLLTHPERILTLPQRALFSAMLERRLRLEPIQYITGEQEFYGLALEVTSAVLIPRPETELLVEALLERLASIASPSIVDVGTGSGAIAIALAKHLPSAKLYALDLSDAALEVARRNVVHHRLESQVHLLRSDLLEAVSVIGPSFDAIVSNPPYIPEGDASTLHPQVRDFEPSLALFAGPRGLEVYERLIPQAAALLKPGGLLALEFGQGQHAALYPHLAAWAQLEVLADLQGIPRVLLARRP